MKPVADRSYNLNNMHASESIVARYIRLTVGEGSGVFSLCLHEILLGMCHWLPGVLGLVVRRLLYPVFFRGLGRRAFIGHHVSLRCPRQISLDAGVVVDDYVQLIATSRQQYAIAVGSGSFIRSYACLNAGPPEGFIKIGHNSGIGQGAVLYGNGGLTIGNSVMIAGQCFVVASSHRFDNKDIPIAEQGYRASGIVIEDNVWIGAGAKILDGVRIGQGAIVGANAVVNRDVAPGSRVGGIPAREL